MAEPLEFARANPVQRSLRRFASSGPGAWVFARAAHHIDRPVFRATRGRHTFASLVAGLPIVMLTTTGARSGRERTVPIVALPTDDGLAVIASNFGQRRHPAWYHNLRANPEATAAVEGRTQRVRAVDADEATRRRIWAEALKVYPGYAEYERRASHRRIGVFVLEPI